jgi:RNA polymerase sigma-70 factor (ECF subfamily)
MQVFNDCLATLPRRAANAFYLSAIEEMDGAGICKVLNVSSSNVWVMLHRARLRLRACLETNWFMRGH